MKIPFDCPSCGAAGAVDESFAGKQVRCKQCNHRFAVPTPGVMDDGGYGLIEPSRNPAAKVVATGLDTGPVFVRSRGDEPSAVLSPRKPRNVKSKSKRRRSENESEFPWKTWLIRLGVVGVIAWLGTALIAPNGLILAGSAAIILGCLMVLVGYAAGAYGAFCEDFLYGFFYLVFPLYTAYYIVTRWFDLWRWFTGSTVGFGLVLIGTQMLRWAGVEE